MSLSQKRSHQLIHDGVKKAIHNHKTGSVKPLVWDGPFVLEKRFFHSHTADMYDKNPMAKRIDPQTVQLKSDNILDIIYA